MVGFCCRTAKGTAAAGAVSEQGLKRGTGCRPVRPVAARRGHKLLQSIEFDPSFAGLADDPDIRQLWQQ